MLLSLAPTINGRDASGFCFVCVQILSTDLHLSKALFSLDPDNLQLHCFFTAGNIVLLFILVFSRPTREDVAKGAGHSNIVYTCFNRPFPSCLEPHYESEAKCKASHVKITFVGI